MAEQHKKAAVISAEGDTEAADLLAKAFGKAGEGLVELRRIETAEEISGKEQNVFQQKVLQNYVITVASHLQARWRRVGTWSTCPRGSRRCSPSHSETTTTTIAKKTIQNVPNELDWAQHFSILCQMPSCVSIPM